MLLYQHLGLAVVSPVHSSKSFCHRSGPGRTWVQLGRPNLGGDPAAEYREGRFRIPIGRSIVFFFFFFPVTNTVRSVYDTHCRYFLYNRHSPLQTPKWRNILKPPRANVWSVQNRTIRKISLLPEHFLRFFFLFLVSSKCSRSSLNWYYPYYDRVLII